MLSSKTTAVKQKQKRRANRRKSKLSPISKQAQTPSSSPSQHTGGPQAQTTEATDALNALLADPLLAKVAAAICNGNGAGFSALVRNKKNGISRRLIEVPRNTLANLAVDIARFDCPPNVLMWFLVETSMDPTGTLEYFISQTDRPKLTVNQRQMLALVLTHHVSTSRVAKDDDDDDGGEAKRVNSVLLEAFCKALASKNQNVVTAYHDHVPTPTICSLTYRSTQINSMIHSPPVMSLQDINGKLLELVLLRILPLINNRPRSDDYYSPLLGPFHAPRARKCAAAQGPSSQAQLGNMCDRQILARIVSFLDVYSANELRKSCRGLYTGVGIAMEDRFPRQLAFTYSNFVSRQEFADAANDESANQFENKVERLVRLATHPRVLQSGELRGWMVHCALVRCAWDVAERLLRTPAAAPLDAPTLYLLFDGFLSTIEGGSKLFNHMSSNNSQRHTTYPIRSGRGRAPSSLAGILPPMDPPLTVSEISKLESLMSHDEPIHVPTSALAVLALLASQLGTRCWLLLDTAYFVPLLAAFMNLPAFVPPTPEMPLDAQAVFSVLVPMARGDQAQAVAALKHNLRDSFEALARTADDNEGTVRNLLHAGIKLGQVDVARVLIDEFGVRPTPAGDDEGGQADMSGFMWFAGGDAEYMCRLAAASGECAMHDLVAEWIHGSGATEEQGNKWSVLDECAPHRRCLVTAQRAGHEQVVRHILTKCGYDMQHDYTKAFMGGGPEQVLARAQALKRGLLLTKSVGDSEFGSRCEVVLREMLGQGVRGGHLLTARLVALVGKGA